MPLTWWRWPVGAIAVALCGPAEAGCSVELSPVDFGVVDTTQRSQGTGEVVVRCDAAAGFEIAISAAGAAGGTRRMNGPDGSRLDYRLFSDAGRAVPWGDGGTAGNPVSASSDGATPRRLTIYGEVPTQSGVPAGEYVASLEVTLAY